jgi:sugar phosphate isomerase/epimerase
MRVGCLTRPWNKFDLATCLDSIAAAGFDLCGLLNQQGGPIIAADTPAERVDEVKAMCGDRGLEPMLVISRAGVDAEVIKRELDQLARLGATVLLHCGVGKEEQHAAFYEAMRVAAPHAAELGLQIVLKPHGGVSATAGDCLRALGAVDHPAFRLWYDAGNIRYYTNTDPVEDVKALAGRIDGMFVKDCRGSHPTGDGDVGLTPGDGEVDLANVFREMVAGGFDGPCLIECLSGTTEPELRAEAAKAGERVRAWLRG